jgi:SHS2 domain-containing protein
MHTYGGLPAAAKFFPTPQDLNTRHPGAKSPEPKANKALIGRYTTHMFELIPHTGDIRVRLAAASLEELFREALAAMMACLEAQADADGTVIHHNVNIASTDRTTLLIDFLNDALALALTAREMFADVRFASFGEADLSATLLGTRAAFGEEIKAVTYHEADVVQNADGSWSTLLVFDL